MRCNTGIEPKYLADQHLIAEYRELPMIIGSLRHNHWQIKSSIPNVFTLGTGHMNFLKNKITYILRRLDHVEVEMRNRGFKCEHIVNVNDIPKNYYNDWVVTQDASNLLRDRISTKLLMPNRVGFYRYKRNIIIDMMSFVNTLKNSPLYEV